MKKIVAAILMSLATVASAGLVNYFLPPTPAPRTVSPIPQPKPVVIERVVIVHEVSTRADTPRTAPVVQYLDGSTSVSPQWKEVYPGAFVRIR